MFERHQRKGKGSEPEDPQSCLPASQRTGAFCHAGNEREIPDGGRQGRKRNRGGISGGICRKPDRTSGTAGWKRKCFCRLSWRKEAGSKNSASYGESVPGFISEGENPGNLTKKACADIHEGGKGSKTGCHGLFSQAARQSAKTAKTTARGLKAIAEAATHAVKAVFAALMAGGGAVFAILILIVGIIGGAAFLGNSQSSEALSAEVLTHTPAIQKYASEFGIPEYVPVIQAIMMQESGGRGTDPMQASECPYNTQYSNTLGVIQDADYSIKVWVQYYADCVWEAGCESPQDLDKLKLSLQGYNYGNGYISWAIRNHGGYSEAKALQFSQEQAAAHGWSGYGDPEYVPHVLRYYSGGGLFAGLFGNGQIVTIAKSQLGNEGGQKFWS